MSKIEQTHIPQKIDFLLLENIFASSEVLQTYFACNLPKCQGGCCLKGDVGDLLTAQEVKISM